MDFPACINNLPPTANLNNMELPNTQSTKRVDTSATIVGTQAKQPNGIDISAISPAISVQNACKSYSNGVPVLKNFNMTVPQGTIYGLLGASGCGKTTILSCLVGIRKLDSGDIFVFGERPGTPECGIPGRCVGYMPQDIALYGQLSIREMLQYFGRIYSMSNSEILGRIEFLSNFLDLPPSSRRIEDLSGGQKRRVSLSCSLIHEASVLILDEPTVGVDPLLRQSIWQYLSDLVAKKHTTVIITSHYIEEARQSTTVGLMRNGRLLVEKSPDILLKEHRTVLLSDIVLMLCRNQEINGNNDKNEVAQALTENSFYSSRRKKLKDLIHPNKPDENAVVGLKFKQTNQMDENQNSNNPRQTRQLRRTQSFKEKTGESLWGTFSRTRAVAARNALILLRSPLFLLAIFFMPSFQLLIVNLTLGPEPKHMKFGIVDPEIDYDLSKCEDLPTSGCLLDNLSCRFIKSLPNNIIDPISVRTKEEAVIGVQAGALWGYMEFPTNFSGHLVDRAGLGIFSENGTIDGSTISLRLDMSHYFAGALLTKGIYESYQKFTVKQLRDCEQNTGKGEIPIRFRTPVYGSNDVTFQDYIGPGVLMMILYFIPYLSCSVAIITDRKQGTLDRSMVAGVNLMDILMGFLLTEGFLIVIQTLISYLLVLFVFQMEIKGSVLAFLSLTILTGFAGLSFGFLIAQIVDEEMEALIIGVGTYMPNLILTGIIWPLEAAPIGIRCISAVMPCTWAIKAIRSIVSRGWSVTHPGVWPGYVTLLIWIAATWILAILVRRARNR